MTLFDEAIYAKNNPLVEMVFRHEADRYFETLKKRLKVVRSMLKELPDFAFDLKLEIHSSVLPSMVTGNVLPRDTIRFTKCGERLRVDFSNL